MNKQQLLNHATSTFLECVKLMEAKNSDYTKGDDAFLNFRFAELVGTPVERAILVRMSDKLARISNLIDKEAQVKDESIADTLKDLINYSAILLAFLQNEYGNNLS